VQSNSIRIAGTFSTYHNVAGQEIMRWHRDGGRT
jgi:hypothetical protein